MTPCPSCGYQGLAGAAAPDPPFAASPACYAASLDLAAYDIERARPDFLHQQAVDAYAAQHPGPPTRPISVWFALVGLHLFADRGLTGRQVQRAHMQLARERTAWEPIQAPASLAGVTVGDVLAQPPGDQRDAALGDWARWVWSRWADHHDEVAALCAARGL